ncbi:MAG: flagellar type III secretion system pore protein FliP [Defluviitaleaceae bacterium]|nr:flagellar type III secretion system pore protein FliP [Defluviitaleaceae bacterium]
MIFRQTEVEAAGLTDDAGTVNIFLFAPNEGDEDLTGSATLQILFLSVFIVLLPSILVVMTTFTRLIIIFSFLRSGLGTQQMPPNTVLIGLALMLTIFLMNPAIEEMNETAFQPLMAGEISTSEAIDNAMGAIRNFMLGQSQAGSGLGENIIFFADIAGIDLEVEDGFITDVDTIPNFVLIPAFILHELAIGFAFGVFIFIPFIIIDMVTASVLMAMGMMMLPPVMISLPFKVMLFVLVDGWRLVISTGIATFVTDYG